ncbi:type I-B CRISPR-associated protein Cas5b [Thermodesulforhabdus norvegica]|uniref:CRISPR-associated protein Cas5t n=1 Tax=Thermodesulforhabdus norvegica TaxID=39841 RepID=A0A1I4TN87_9BACT|nr:type I-B CRISPR-associated protein Cas5b [Thermodesulforhabdus norvegica]SFM78093.1 CRISPR-associated protein Cas5t [Thermodesulforhabdus norvegica]
MLEGIRIEIAAYTASFRVPHYVGHQLTLTVPPLSTIYGLLSAATGRWILPEEVDWMAYRFEYESRGEDLEKIYQFERNKVGAPAKPGKSTVVRREFLVMPRLILYLPLRWENCFRNPRYTLLLGRTQDVAFVEKIRRVSLQRVSDGEVRGCLVPFELISKMSGSAILYNLPVAFNDEPVRSPLKMAVFGIVDFHNPVRLETAGDWLVRNREGGDVVLLFRKEWTSNGTSATAG